MFINVNYSLQHFLFNCCGRSIYTVLRHILTVTLFMSRQNSITWRHVNITVLIASINNLRYVGTEFQDINYEGLSRDSLKPLVQISCRAKSLYRLVLHTRRKYLFVFLQNV